MRVKTVWFQRQGERSPEEKAGVLASTVWRLADQAVTNLSKADYDIITPERGFRIIGEFCAFLVHASDRLLYGRVEEARRAALVTELAMRLAALMEGNIRALVPEDGFDYKANFLGMIERRGSDYAAFGAEATPFPDFPALRYLGNAIRDVMTAADRTWVVDQVLAIEAPQAIDTLARTVNGLLGHGVPSRRPVPSGGGE